MKLRTRLIVTLAAIALVVAGPAIYAVSRLATLRDIASQMRTRHAEAFLTLGKLQTSLAELDRYEREYLIAGDRDQRVAVERALATSREMVNELLEMGYSTEASQTSQTLARLQGATMQLIALMEAERVQEASAYFEQVKPLLLSVQDLKAIATTIDERSKEGINTARRISANAATTTLGALIICLLIAIGVGIWNAAAVTTPIMQLRQSTARVAEGDFVMPDNLPLDRKDELGDLSRSFNWMTQQLRTLDQMKAEFISIATHELKTPINVISGYAELIEEGIYGPPTARQREALDTIREQTRLLTNLVNQLLDVSRFEAGGLQLEMREVVLRDLLARVERSFSVLARRKSIDFSVDIDSSVPHAILADADRLGDQVIGNLLSNALKFTPESGSIRIRAWAQPDGVHIEVQDSGVGVPADQLPYIFDKYFQVGQQARSTGAGLGLAIAREIVEAHGGWITAESQPGRGTSFVFVVPARAASGPADHLSAKTA